MRNKETDMTLEKRIETSIAENTDPFTTDADIRFFETEEWNDELTLGTKIIGDFGGYEPLWEGKVVAVECFNGSTTWMCASEIDAWGKKSKIGYYTEDGYYG
jgi:uncharacterized protein YuzE